MIDSKHSNFTAEKVSAPLTKSESESESDSEPCVKMRRTHYPVETDICLTCGHPFTPRRPWQRFCSTACRRQHHRKDTRDTILMGIVDTARALGYTKAGFIAKLDQVWTEE
jgi:hypothetical protein